MLMIAGAQAQRMATLSPPHQIKFEDPSEGKSNTQVPSIHPSIHPPPLYHIISTSTIYQLSPRYHVGPPSRNPTQPHATSRSPTQPHAAPRNITQLHSDIQNYLAQLRLSYTTFFSSSVFGTSSNSMIKTN